MLMEAKTMSEKAEESSGRRQTKLPLIYFRFNFNAVMFESREIFISYLYFCFLLSFLLIIF